MYIYIYRERERYTPTYTHTYTLRISKFGVWVKRILKRRRWIFLAHRLIS